MSLKSSINSQISTRHRIRKMNTMRLERRRACKLSGISSVPSSYSSNSLAMQITDEAEGERLQAKLGSLTINYESDMNSNYESKINGEVSNFMTEVERQLGSKYCPYYVDSVLSNPTQEFNRSTVISNTSFSIKKGIYPHLIQYLKERWAAQNSIPSIRKLKPKRGGLPYETEDDEEVKVLSVIKLRKKNKEFKVDSKLELKSKLEYKKEEVQRKKQELRRMLGKREDIKKRDIE